MYFIRVRTVFFNTKILCSSRIFASAGLGVAEQIVGVHPCHLEDKTGRMPDWFGRDRILNDIT